MICDFKRYFDRVIFSNLIFGQWTFDRLMCVDFDPQTFDHWMFGLLSDIALLDFRPALPTKVSPWIVKSSSHLPQISTPSKTLLDGTFAHNYWTFGALKAFTLHVQKILLLNNRNERELKFRSRFKWYFICTMCTMLKISFFRSSRIQ